MKVIDAARGLFSGKMGGMIFYVMDGKTYARKLPERDKRREPSERQKGLNRRFRAVQQAYRVFGMEVSPDVWRAAAREQGRRACNLFHAANCGCFDAGGRLADPETFQFSAGSLLLPREVAVEPLGGRRFRVTWEEERDMATAAAGDLLRVGFIPEEEMLTLQPAEAEGRRADGEGTLAIEPIPGVTRYHVYVYFAREDGSAYSPSRHFTVEIPEEEGTGGKSAAPERVSRRGQETSRTGERRSGAGESFSKGEFDVNGEVVAVAAEVAGAGVGAGRLVAQGGAGGLQKEAGVEDGQAGGGAERPRAVEQGTGDDDMVERLPASLVAIGAPPRPPEPTARVVEDGVGAGQASGSAGGERPGVPQAEEAQRGGAERAVEVAHDEDRRRGAGALEGVDFRPEDGGRSPALPLAPPLAAPHGGEVADEDVERVASGEHALAIEDVAGGLLFFPVTRVRAKQSACRNEQHPKSFMSSFWGAVHFDTSSA